MTTTLDELIRDLAARGELNHLSISGDGKQFNVSFAPASVYGISHASDPDPVKAIQMAVSQPKMKRRAATNMKPTPEPDLASRDPQAQPNPDTGQFDEDTYDPAA